MTVGGGAAAPVLVKDVQRHPVRGDALHVDLLRVRMDETIHTTVTLHLVGADVAPGVMAGGVLSQGIVELNIEALPGDIPDEGIDLDVSGHGDQRHGHALDHDAARAASRSSTTRTRWSPR